jgi:carboxylate-amine ligase
VQGHDSGFDSARLNSVTAFPLSGRAPFVLSWDEFCKVYFAKMERTGIIKSMKDFYWDLRPKPEYGTIELRVCDTPLTVERAAALAAYLQAICRHLLERRDAGSAQDAPLEDDYLVYNYNRFQAARFGLDGVITHPKTYEQIPLRDDILATLRLMEPHAEFLGSMEALVHLADAASGGSDSSFLRAQYERQGSCEGMVNAAIQRFRGERRAP